MNPFVEQSWPDEQKFQQLAASTSYANQPQVVHQNRILPRVQVNPVPDFDTNGTQENISRDNQPNRPNWQQLPPPENTQELLICKLFYFCFYAAFGSLFPLMGVYFKQLGMSPLQTGFLIGVRPFIEMFSAPFWIQLANRHGRAKQMLVCSLCCWLLFTGALAFIRPPAAACVMRNDTNILLYPAYFGEGGQTNKELQLLGRLPPTDSPNKQRNEELQEAGAALALPFKSGFGQMLRLPVTPPPSEWPANRFTIEQLMKSTRPALAEEAPLGSSPLRISGFNTESDQKITPGSFAASVRSVYVWPPHTRLVYRADEVDEVFVLLLLLVLLGEFFAAPAVPFADAATMSLLHSQPDLYGRQRMFGSCGWALAMALIGVALDRSTHFPLHPCAVSFAERNYRICFQTFAVLMCMACLLAGRLRGFPNKPNRTTEERNQQLGQQPSSSVTADQRIHLQPLPLQRQSQNPTLIVQGPSQSSQMPSSAFCGSYRPGWNNSAFVTASSSKAQLLEKWRSAVFAQRDRRLPNWLTALRNGRFAALLLLACFMGFGVGLVFTFLFWHLQELGGSPTLFGTASVINHLSEIGAYFHSLRYIRQYGRLKVLGFALLCNLLRFLFIACIQEAWHILPFEFLQGITHAAVWATLCSLLEDAAPNESPEAAQAWLHAAYAAIGKGSGSLLGGLFIGWLGTRAVFGLYALASLVVLLLLLAVSTRIRPLDHGIASHTNAFQTTESIQPNAAQNLASGNMTVSSAGPALCGLTPHGVPTAPLGSILTEPPPSPQQPTLDQFTTLTPQQKMLLQQNDPLTDQLISGTLRDWKPDVRTYRQTLQKQME